MSTVTDGKVVFFHYTLTDPAGAVIDSSVGREPMPYLHGAGNIVSGLERQLTGLAVGAKVQALVPAAEGYGERGGPPPQAVPKAAFPKGMPLEKGVPVRAESPDGEVLTLFIDRVEGDDVYLDQNHPLAGVDLSFAVEITGVRDATAEEMAHGHPHAPGGHHH
jgi:FKBP-type peptidyl-prolyl cis-trans isomerase SlyD